MRNHKSLKKMGLHMQSKIERLTSGTGGSPFNSKSWNERQKAIQNRIKKAVARVQIRKMERLQAIKDNKPVVYSIK
jgi:hypothetical protein